MEHTTLVCSAQGWCGPIVSTFSPEWDDNVNSFLMAPDVIKPPPQFQDTEEPSQTSLTNSAVVIRWDKDCVNSQKERRSRAVSNIEVHRHSLSLTTTINSNPGVTRRRCESYALSYPSSSSEDSGSDSTSARRRDRLPDAVPRSRSRSIVLRKAKRKPAPPVRTVSLQRLTTGKHSEHKTKAHLKKDGQNIMLLPDLIPTSKPEVGKCKQSTPTNEAPEKVAMMPSISCHRALNELQSSEPYKSGLGPSVAAPTNDITHGNSEANTSPSSSQSSPSQPYIPSPSKPLVSNSPSSVYGSQCETPTQSVLTSVDRGPSQLGCRMRPKPSSAIPGQRARHQNARLSLQLPEVQQCTPDPEPSTAQPKANRRFSDSTEATRPKQRLSNSMFIMPVVTQEELNNVRLRSISSFDLENAQETLTEVIEEETERGRNSLSPANSPKAKPPVAPKPQRNKWPPNAMVQPCFGTVSDPEPSTVIASERQDIYTMVNKEKPAVNAPSPNIASIVQGHHQRWQQFFDGHTLQPMREPHQPQPPCTLEPQDSNLLSFNKTSRSNPYELQKKRRASTPILAKTPGVDNSPSDNSATLKNSDNVQSPSKLCKSPKSPTTASQYHVTLYGVIPPYPMAVEQQHSSTPDHPSYNVEKRDSMPDLGPLQLVGEEDDVFLYKSKSHTTEDLFTIIHRSKRKLLGRKDSFENKQGDLGTQTLGGGGSKISSQNDNFMAFLRRTRSAKAGCSERISATELLRSSKSTATIAASMTHCKNSYVQSHGP
ncbi:NHS-like protein 2 [Myxocyprinus asiaticus]|uniref:NHS-like protein 2 n=1 Tax=Myxocyprinus asiaticus TaxID=70543 RepID=UPI002222508F|nr:NHS-like protein 2 [Myxocyprinus asiaticus]XP_051536111.1 NHS-like protein 2 [Myxocyprinus asiaticus]XP_051536113.1 NHS-like protein 2 [Myxocyprinus asiaticus]XP_051536114.1 NHS-like protein 2 [Myxocyprinus asiaticus]